MPDCIIMAGIDADLLEPEPSLGQEEDFSKTIALLNQSGGLILCSACGLYKRHHFDRIKMIYALAEKPDYQLHQTNIP